MRAYRLIVMPLRLRQFVLHCFASTRDTYHPLR